MEIVEGVVARECGAAVEYMGERLRRFINVDRLDERDRDGISTPPLHDFETHFVDSWGVEMGFARKTAPAYVQACCVLRGVTATNVGIGLYLDNFAGTEEEKVTPRPQRNEIYCQNAARDVIYPEMTVWGKLIANADIVDPLIFGRQISAYSALWKYMKDEPEMISMISKVPSPLPTPGVSPEEQ